MRGALRLYIIIYIQHHLCEFGSELMMVVVVKKIATQTLRY